MADITRLPDRDDGARGLLDLADVFSPEQVFRLVGWLRDPGAGDVTFARQVLAARLLEQVMAADPALTYAQARRQLAGRLGYNRWTRSNLYKLITAGQAHTRAPAGDTGGEHG